MKPRICICCGEAITQGNKLSRNPNICASCSSLADGLDAEEDEADSLPNTCLEHQEEDHLHPIPSARSD